MNIKKKHTPGFTIVEVMIVFAIASILVTLVLLAANAANRNSRDARRKADALALSTALEQWAQNNNGILPENPADINIGLGALAGPFCDQNYLSTNCTDFKDPSGNVGFANSQYLFEDHSFDAAYGSANTEPDIDCTTPAGANGVQQMQVWYTNSRQFSIQVCLESGSFKIRPQ